MEHIKDGVYFGLPAADYHADPALGSSDLRDILRSPQNWAYANPRFNPLAKAREREGAWLRLGSAIHTLLLEGEQVFQARYCSKPEVPRDALCTAEDLKAHAEKLGIKVSGTKANMIAKIRAHDTKVPIEAEIVERFMAEKGDRTVLTDEEWARTFLSAASISKNPHLKTAFIGGFPEVSVFWTLPSGVRLKARIDYLRVQAVVDLKSMSNWSGQSFDQSWVRSVQTYRYDMQAAHYMTARNAARVFFQTGAVVVGGGALPPSEAWIKAFVATEDPVWVWVVYQTEGAPISQGYTFPTSLPMFGNALLDVGRAVESYRENFELYGHSIWPMDRPIQHLTQEHFPPSFGVYQ